MHYNIFYRDVALATTATQTRLTIISVGGAKILVTTGRLLSGVHCCVCCCRKRNEESEDRETHVCWNNGGCGMLLCRLLGTSYYIYRSLGRSSLPADRWKQEVALRRDYPQHQGCASIFHLTPGPPVASLQLLNAREASNGKFPWQVSRP
jgi:hypothetical protein